MGKTNFNTYIKIKQHLVQKFGNECFKNNKLPSEAALAKELEISLVTLREALMMLALEGYITKRHGSGNYVHPSAFDPTYRNDLGITFADAFRQQGYEPDMRIVGIMKRFAGEKYSNIFKVNEDDIIESAEVIYTANKLPSIFSIQSLPAKNLKKSFQIGKENWNIHEFIYEYCGRHITHSINEYKAIEATERVATMFEIQSGSPLLYCEQLFYDIQDQPILFNVHYFHPERYGVRMLQNWDLNAK
ncbi:GntR family transcriptional regulator [Lachnospiraceae bacterium LCP25S3_G4]